MRSRYRFLCLFAHGMGQKSYRNLTEVSFVLISSIPFSTKGGTGVSGCVFTKDNGVCSCACTVTGERFRIRTMIAVSTRDTKHMKSLEVNQ